MIMNHFVHGAKLVLFGKIIGAFFFAIMNMIVMHLHTPSSGKRSESQLRNKNERQRIFHKHARYACMPCFAGEIAKTSLKEERLAKAAVFEVTLKDASLAAVFKSSL